MRGPRGSVFVDGGLEVLAALPSFVQFDSDVECSGAAVVAVSGGVCPDFSGVCGVGG